MKKQIGKVQMRSENRLSHNTMKNKEKEKEKGKRDTDPINPLARSIVPFKGGITEKLGF